MSVAYGVIFALSLLLPFGYWFIFRRSQREPWLLVLYLSVCVVNFGYLLLSLSKTLAVALTANKIAYLGQTLVPLCMLMLVSGLCGYRYRRWVKLLLLGAAAAMFALVLTTGHLDWYYASVELTFADGAAKLVKEYGPLHFVNLLYVLAYFVAMLTVIGVSLWRKARGVSQKLVGLMLAVVIGNIGMWIVEKQVPLNFEFLSVSYLMSEFVFFFVYLLLEDYLCMSVAFEPSAPSVEEKIDAILARLPSETVLSTRQREILAEILAYRSRREIASALHLSENTVKTHTATLYRALGVSGRDEIYAMLQK